MMPGWPASVRSLAPDGLLFLGIDEKDQLYWTARQLRFSNG